MRKVFIPDFKEVALTNSVLAFAVENHPPFCDICQLSLRYWANEQSFCVAGGLQVSRHSFVSMLLPSAFFCDGDRLGSFIMATEPFKNFFLMQ